jgi:hypothetical protein
MNRQPMLASFRPTGERTSSPRRMWTGRYDLSTNAVSASTVSSTSRTSPVNVVSRSFPRGTAARAAARQEVRADSRRAAWGQISHVDVDERPAGVAGVDIGTRLDHRRQRDVVGLLHRLAEGADDSVGDARLQSQRVADRDRDVADLELDESANVAGFSPVPEILITAMSSGGNEPTSLAGYCLPVEVVTVNDVAPLTTWLFVTMSPRESKTMPEPSPVWSRICTTDGDTEPTTFTNDPCSALRRSTTGRGRQRRARCER